MSQSLLRIISLLLFLLTSVSCTTAYDAYGRPQPVVDPGAALLGVAAAGLIGFALADNSRGSNQCNRNDYDRGQWNRRYRYNHCQNGRY